MSDPSDDFDEDAPAAGGRSGLFDRLISGGRAGADRPSRPTPSVKRSVEQLDDRERRYAGIASGASVLFGLIIYLIETGDSKFRLTKGQLTPQTTLIVGIVFGILLFGATLWGRRALVGFAALFTGIAFTNSYLLAALPFLALAMWLLYRSYKVQKEAAASSRSPRADSGGSPATSGRASPARSKPSPKGGDKRGRARPEANKRYTPKRPPPPPPKPSRRDRKAKAAE